MGYEDPVKAFMTSVGKQQYTCPVCLIACEYKFIHMVITRHEQMSMAEDESVASTDDSSHPENKEESKQVVSRDSNSHTSSATPADKVTVNKTEVESQVNHTPSAPPKSPAHEVHIPSAPPEPPTQPNLNSESGRGQDAGFRHIVSEHEQRRRKRFKGALHGFKHMNASVDTVIILDSNGRDIKGEHIDIGGVSDKTRVVSIGGLCVAATSAVLEDSNLRYPNIKRVEVGLGTNDRLHAREHPGEKIDYLRDLNSAIKKVFPNCSIGFILPFSGIKGLGQQYVNDLRKSIQASGVGWKIHTPPAMKDQLVSPRMLHLTRPGRKLYIDWLRKRFGPKKLSSAINSGPTSNVCNPPQHLAQPVPVQVSNVAGRGCVSAPDPRGFQANNISGQARELAAAFYQLMCPPWRRDPTLQPERPQPPQWPHYYD